MKAAIDKQERQRLNKMKKYEKMAYRDGHRLIAGIDEVGRGPIAGPVVAAAVILPSSFLLAGVNDSKQVSQKKRVQLADRIKSEAIAWSVAIIAADVIDQVNILQATKQAMHRASSGLQPGPDYILVDALRIPEIEVPQFPIIKGDCLSISIACASIIAKVERDRLMEVYDDLYPGYGFAAHKGYGTREHLSTLMKKGPSPIHRFSFEPIKSRFGPQDIIQLNLFE